MKSQFTEILKIFEEINCTKKNFKNLHSKIVYFEILWALNYFEDTKSTKNNNNLKNKVYDAYFSVINNV